MGKELKKTWNTKILKKLNERVSFVVIGKGKRERYEVFKRNKKVNWFKTTYSDWQLALTTTNLEKALHMKHNLWILVLGDLGVRPWLIERKKRRK